MIWPRILIAGLLLALPIWSGAAGRSLWTLAPTILVFTVAYVDGKNAIWRRAFLAAGAGEKLKMLTGALLAETVLVAILFFTAAGIAQAFGALGDRVPFDRLDAGLAGAALAVSVLAMAIIRGVEGDRDPLVVALENLAEAGAPPDIAENDDDYGRGDDDEEREAGVEAWRNEADGIAYSAVLMPIVIFNLARRISEHDDPAAAAQLLHALASRPDAADAPGARHVRRVGLTGLRYMLETAEGRAAVEGIDPAPLLLDILRADSADWVRYDAVWLADALDLRHDALTAAIAVLAEAPPRGDEDEDEDQNDAPASLRRRAKALHERLRTP